MNRLRTAERPPLDGLTVVVTRPRSRAAPLRSALTAAGASVVEFPTIRFREPEDGGALREALSRLGEYDWVVFTSPTGVERTMEGLASLGGGAGALAGRAVAAIGPATRRALEEAGVPVRVVPARYRAEELVEAILAAARPPGARSPGRPLAGVRFLIPRAAEARPTLPDGLRAAGAVVDVVAAYRTEPDSPDVGALREALRRGEVDWVTFTASSTARAFVRLLGREIGRARVAAIGPITAETSRRLGLPVGVTATEYTAAGLVDALVAEAGRASGPAEG